MRDGGRPGGGAWIGSSIVVLALFGAVAGYQLQRPTDAETRDVERCQPVVWHENETDLRGWNLLREQGYQPRDDDGAEALYPPNCKGVHR